MRPAVVTNKMDVSNCEVNPGSLVDEERPDRSKFENHKADIYDSEKDAVHIFSNSIHLNVFPGSKVFRLVS